MLGFGEENVWWVAFKSLLNSRGGRSLVRFASIDYRYLSTVVGVFLDSY